ncbi:MAG: hypothetical protein LBF05_01355 [Tannerella sp.]|nr:hypothetical protein [Tannerella sp.]
MLLFPTQGRDENGMPFSNITYRKDGGNIYKACLAPTRRRVKQSGIRSCGGAAGLHHFQARPHSSFANPPIPVIADCEIRSRKQSRRMEDPELPRRCAPRNDAVHYKYNIDEVWLYEKGKVRGIF